MPIARTALLAAAAIVTLALTSASAASADSSGCTAGTACAGRVTFQSYGEVFVVYDQVADSDNPVALYWLPDGSGPHLVWNTTGNGTSARADLEFPEGDWITYRACLGRYGQAQLVKTETCGPIINDFS